MEFHKRYKSILSLIIFLFLFYSCDTVYPIHKSDKTILLDAAIGSNNEISLLLYTEGNEYSELVQLENGMETDVTNLPINSGVISVNQYGELFVAGLFSQDSSFYSSFSVYNSITDEHISISAGTTFYPDLLISKIEELYPSSLGNFYLVASSDSEAIIYETDRSMAITGTEVYDIPALSEPIIFRGYEDSLFHAESDLLGTTIWEYPGFLQLDVNNVLFISDFAVTSSDLTLLLIDNSINQELILYNGVNSEDRSISLGEDLSFSEDLSRYLYIDYSDNIYICAEKDSVYTLIKVDSNFIVDDIYWNKSFDQPFTCLFDSFNNVYVIYAVNSNSENDPKAEVVIYNEFGTHLNTWEIY